MEEEQSPNEKNQVSFKNTRETAQAINGYTLTRAVKFLENVQAHKEAVPMRRYAGGTGRAAQGTILIYEYQVKSSIDGI